MDWFQQTGILNTVTLLTQCLLVTGVMIQAVDLQVKPPRQHHCSPRMLNAQKFVAFNRKKTYKYIHIFNQNNGLKFKVNEIVLGWHSRVFIQYPCVQPVLGAPLERRRTDQA